MRLASLVVVAACGHGFFDPQHDCPPPPPTGDGALATIQFVQANTVTSSTKTYIAVVFPTAQRQGDLAVAIVQWGAGPAINSVADNAGNTWNVAVAPYGPSSFQQAMFYAENIPAQAAGVNTVTVSFNATASCELRIAEYAGIATANALDVTQSNQASGMVADSGSLMTTHAHDLLVASDTTDGTTTGAGSGYTSRLLTSFANILEDKVVFDVGSYDASAPLSASANWVMELAAFRAAD